MNTQQRLKQIKGLVQQAQAMHKPVFIGADELQIFIESLDAVERECDELRKTLAATQDGAAEAINHSLQLQSDLKASSANAMAWMKRALKAEAGIERRAAAAGEAVGYGFQHKETGKFGSWLKPKSLAHDCDNYCAVPLYTAAQPAVLPPGWKLVPIEPTEDMVISGFESKPREGFSDPDDWGAFEAMSGCEQAAHKARLCYAAMLAAAPAPGGDDVKKG